MKIIISLVVLLVFTTNSYSQIANPNYNKKLADSIGSAPNGMRMYTFVILKTGPVTIDNKHVLDSLFTGHMNNIKRLVKENKLIVAGPFEKNDKTYRGLFIFTVNDIEEINQILQTDPAIHAKIFETEIFKWYGSAALPLYLPFHDQLCKFKQ